MCQRCENCVIQSNQAENTDVSVFSVQYYLQIPVDFFWEKYFEFFPLFGKICHIKMLEVVKTGVLYSLYSI